jgi:hypothetical protein
VPLAYAAYALSLAIAAGTVLRKTIPAMVVTLLGYLAARIPIDALARPRYLLPLSVTWDPYTTLSVHKPFRATALMGPYNGPDWVFYLGWVNHAGQLIDPDNVYRVCNVPDMALCQEARSPPARTPTAGSTCLPGSRPIGSGSSRVLRAPFSLLWPQPCSRWPSGGCERESVKRHQFYRRHHGTVHDRSTNVARLAR